MSLIRKLLNIDSPVKGSAWTNPLWWGDLGASTAGVAVGPDTALQASTVYACVNLLAETIAALPLIVYRYLDNDRGRDQARNHPLYFVLHDQPNESQTAFEFLQMMQTHALLRGSGYAEIISGKRGFVDQLIPLHPDNVIKEKMGRGRYRYRVTDEDGRERLLNDENIFEIGGLTLDGWNTVSVVTYARDSFGLSLAAEKYGSRFFRNDSRPGGVLQTDNKLSRDAALRIKGDWETLHTGANQQRVAVLEQGLKWQAISITPDEAQFLETREFQAEDICRWFRVPPHMIGLTSKATSWGSGIEQMSIGFVTYTLMPWLTRWKQAISRDLIIAPERFFASFVVEGLLRGDIGSRYGAYATGRQWGWLSVNDIRRLENMNPVTNGDVYLQPLNMVEAGEIEIETANGGDQAHYYMLAEEAAGRVVRKELAAMTRAMLKTKGTGEAWRMSVKNFYDEHAPYVAQTMRITLDQAIAYVDSGRTALLTDGPETMSDWNTARVADLARLAIGENDGA